MLDNFWTISICQIFTNQLCKVPLHLKKILKSCVIKKKKISPKRKI